MGQAEEVAITKAVTMLAVTFRQEAHTALFRAYQVGLDGLSVQEVEQATDRAIKECEFMPPPAVLRKLSGVLDAESRAILAWDAFQEAERKHGHFDSVDFDDPVINATVRNLGGWPEITERIDGDKTDTWVRRDFERIYQALCRSGISAEQAQYLPGWCERQNRFNGYPEAVPPPIKLLTRLPAHTKSIGLLAGPDRRKE